MIAKINDPLRAEAYRALGLETICRTIILGDALVTAAVDGAEATNGFVEPPTAEPLRGAPRRHRRPAATGVAGSAEADAEPPSSSPATDRTGASDVRRGGRWR